MAWTQLTRFLGAGSPAQGGFELRRREQETRNELVINLFRGGVLAFVFTFHLANHLVHFAVFRTPLIAPILIGAGLVATIGLHVYFRRDPVYFAARKYLLTIFEGALVVTIAAWIEFDHGGWQIGMVPAMFFALLILISSLRYSSGVVALASGQALLFQVLFFIPRMPEEARVYSVPTLVLLIGTGLLVAHLVSSLTRLHREAVWKERLARFLAPELVAQIARRPQLLERETQVQVATILFVDLRGFTAFSERMAPQQVLAVLNSFLQEATDAVMAQRGMVDKYIGDAVMAVFGVPLHQPDHASAAVRAALDVERRVDKLNEQLAARGHPTLSIGVGIHTGEVVAGAIGSAQRLEYTVIGDPVNVAARVESLTRMYPSSILFTDATRDALDGSIQAERVDTVQVKGRNEPVTIWAPRSTSAPVPALAAQGTHDEPIASRTSSEGSCSPASPPSSARVRPAERNG